MGMAYKTQESAEALWVVRDKVQFMGEVPEMGLSVVEVTVPPGSGTPPHKHQSIEIFRVLSGEITFTLFDAALPTQIVAHAGDVLTLRSYQPHNYVNTSNLPAQMLAIVENSMSRFFRDLGHSELPPAGLPSTEEIKAVMAACQRHGIEILNI
ncbi:cupin domain-containing protein [Rhizobium etli]|uniref:cupin domain-containing protein n=1 Tax=Rhizobium etli TaxID=29449 RepID=UPI000383A499|nr:cupin domain-containing protein [Rhizobium etli]AGS25010.1 cupin 2 domain-containing protein [Rhizobium etli bv. mimosae str. Mim1]